MPTEILLRQDHAGVATLTLNRPAQRNALSMALMTDLLAELDAIDTQGDRGAVVIAGAGPAFCAGHDLREVQALAPDARRLLFATCSRLMLRITSLRCPVIAQVHGIATAAGCQLVATCDLAVAAATARFATPGVNIGLFCSTPMVALSRAVGNKAAMGMLLTGDLIDAAEARQIGLINQSVPEPDLAAATAALAAKIASRSRMTVATGKAAFYHQSGMALAEAYDYTSAVMTKNLDTADAAEGIDAFLHRRAPVWVNG